jgi:mono/diheme cytochrome c family protein
MKKVLILSVMVIFSLFAVSSAFAKPAKCPQKRSTKSAPAGLKKKDNKSSEYKKADAKNGKLIYTKKAKPMACKMCHGKLGDGGGKLGAALTPKPRNFTCAKTMKDISAGQMFHIIKKGSKGTGMVAHGKTLKDKEIWDVVKYVRSTFMK